VIDYINGHDGVSWTTMENIAADFRTRYPFPGPEGSPFIPGLP
jgi:hypothetical protein